MHEGCPRGDEGRRPTLAVCRVRWCGAVDRSQCDHDEALGQHGTRQDRRRRDAESSSDDDGTWIGSVWLFNNYLASVRPLSSSRSKIPGRYHLELTVGYL